MSGDALLESDDVPCRVDERRVVGVRRSRVYWSEVLGTEDRRGMPLILFFSGTMLKRAVVGSSWSEYDICSPRGV
jgi:hypothetical protein